MAARSRRCPAGPLPALDPIFPRSAGVLLPLFSVPARHGVGDLGPGAHRFVEWCAAAGFTWWQMLPVGPIGPGDSPYSSSSAFAGEPLFLSLEALVDQGLLASADVSAPAALGKGRARYSAARKFKLPRLRAAYEKWVRRRRSRRSFDAWCAAESTWLEPWVRYCTDDEANYVLFLQFEFDRQWSELRRRGRELGVRLMGDAPIFVGAQSADVAARPELFRLDEDGAPTVLTGCPPDAFSAEGQLWGHPHYAWDAHREERFGWWRRRVARQLALFDAVRIDHFIGFHKAWEVPAGDSTAAGGAWAPAPGEELLTALREEQGGRMALVAEDLGATDEGVLALRDAFGLPGMRVLQWGFSPHSYHAPHAVPENAVVYPGTHDNDTVAGWLRAQDPGTRRRFRAHTGGAAATAAWDMWRTACATPAHTAIVQLQDVLGLGRAARTNLPGTAKGNWTWRAVKRDLGAPLARRCRELAEATDRIPED